MGEPSKRPFYWKVWSPHKDPESDGPGRWTRPPGEDLAAFRRGTGREPGEVPAMWPHYTQLLPTPEATPHLRAEHLALTLYGTHQQGESIPVHVLGVSLGSAMASLRRDGRHSAEAVDRRFVAAATASDASEVAIHLRSLVRLLKTLPRTQGLDYTRLFNDLVAWQDPTTVGRVRRRWGADYYLQQEHDTKVSNSKETA